MKIYPAGKIPKDKGHEVGTGNDWRDRLFLELKTAIPELKFLSPVNPTVDENDPTAAFGFCCYLIQSSDLVIVNASEKIGAGTSQEILIAKYFKKPVITVLPRNTHHRRQNLQMGNFLVPDWKHPFIVETSDLIVDNVDALIIAIIQEDYLKRPIKTMNVVDESIHHYRLVYNK